MESLRRIENLSPGRRSSMVGQAGVLRDLQMLEKSEAIEWLQRNIHSPVSRDWGNLLNSLEADWQVLKAWMHSSKEHALAAADAIDIRISLNEELPQGCSAAEVLDELRAINALYPSPRLGKSLEVVTAFSSQEPVPSEITEAAKLLFGPIKNELFLPAKSQAAKWNSLFQKADNKYSLLVMDWKASEIELQRAVSALPIFKSVGASGQQDPTIETIENGNDEFVFVVLRVLPRLHGHI